MFGCIEKGLTKEQVGVTQLAGFVSERTVYHHGEANLHSAIVSFAFIKRKFKVHIQFPGISRIKFELKNGWHILVSSFAINVYLNSNILILGL